VTHYFAGMATDTVDLTLIGKTLETMKREQREARKELADIRQLALGLVDQGGRTDRRILDLKDELELMIKAELMGRLANFESRTTDAMIRAIDALEARVARLEQATADKLA
jgi:cell division septum initiation protein DivIVA